MSGPTELNVIDCDTAPFIPDGWKVEEQQKGGQFKWDASKVSLYLSELQKSGKGIEGNKLRKELAGNPVPLALLGPAIKVDPASGITPAASR